MKVQMYNFNDELVVVEYFQLLQWIGAINLEEQGLRHSRGSVTAHVRRILSCPKNHPRKLLLAHLRETQQDIAAQLDGTAELNLQPEAS